MKVSTKATQCLTQKAHPLRTRLNQQQVVLLPNYVNFQGNEVYKDSILLLESNYKSLTIKIATDLDNLSKIGDAYIEMDEKMKQTIKGGL